MDTPETSAVSSISGCSHLFCFDCISQWSDKENSCPLCKAKFTKIDRVSVMEDGKVKKRKRGKTEKEAMSKKVKAKTQVRN